MPIVALLTDFGWQDPYTGIIKGVLLNTNPDLSIIDITHSVPPQDIYAAAFFLGMAVPYFPTNTIFLAVVDPGVGTERAALVCKIGTQYFVGPDNGIFTLVLQNARACVDPIISHRITEKRFMLPQISQTFHARDIFAPVAAHLSLGTPLDAFGPKHEPILLSFSSPQIHTDKIKGEVQYVDGFGNLITNIHRKHLNQLTNGPRIVEINDIRIPILTAYSQAEISMPLAIIGSYDLLEIAVRNGSAARFFHAQRGIPVIVAA